jgi:hypothetical protein
MTVTVNHAKTNAISDWTQAQLDEQIALGNFPPGTTLANIVLPSDWNNDHTLTGLGTMAEQDATAVAITGGTINNTTIGATTATTGVFTTLQTTGSSGFGTSVPTANRVVVKGGASAQCFRVEASTGGFANIDIHSDRTSGNLGGFRAFQGSDTQGSYEMLPQADKSATFFQLGFGTSGPTTQFVISRTASSVNYVQVTGAATTIQPIISAQGSDGNIALNLRSKGTSGIWFGSSDGAIQFQVTPTTSAVNNLRATGSIAGNALPFVAGGSDTNISMAFQPKGTGAIDLAAGSSGVNISNGGTVTAITRTAAGSAYTSAPTLAITAPTTAGGVQATATTLINMQGTQTVVGGGTGYTLNDVLTIVGGTRPGGAATLTVTGVSAGVITSVSVSAAANYSVAPTNPASVTGGTGTGATFTLAWGLSTSFTITNAGSGYIEQPTVTFSGGGGSGAAAYATVGSGTTVKSIGSTMSFNTPSGEGFRVVDSGTSTTTYWSAYGGSSTITNQPRLRAQTTSNAWVETSGAGSVILATNSGVVQALVSHTASAVNYVQVTGAVTSGSPTISAQGSDGNIPLNIRSKGVFNINLQNGNNNNGLVVDMTSGTTLANYVAIAGKVTGSAPTISALGTDTDIDLALTPKGTGVVQFGTYTGTILTPTGYITIKDSGGTTRRLLVG